MCLISIIVPVYNAEKYLNSCIESILAQSFGEFELILVDDGSTDSSGLICDQYAGKDCRIKVYHQINRGVAYARNLGLDIAMGEYIAFCDSDDTWQPQLLERAYSLIIKEKVDSVVFNYTRIEIGKNDYCSNFSSGIVRLKNESEKIQYLIMEFMNYNHGYEVWTRLFKREIIEKAHIRFCLACNGFAEDLGFVINYILSSQSFLCFDESLYNYYVHEGSIMSNSRNRARLNDINEVAFSVEKYFKAEISKRKYKKQFAVIHFLLLYNQYQKIIGTPQYSQLSLEIKKIERQKWYRQKIKQLFRNYKNLKQYFGKANAEKILLFSHYCLHCSWKLFSIESYLFYKSRVKEKKRQNLCNRQKW